MNVNLNEMRELKNVVAQIMSDKELAQSIQAEADKLMDIKLHNAGLDAISGEYDTANIRSAKAAYYLSGLISSIVFYMEDGNDFIITMNDSLYPNAEKPNWKEEE